MEPAFLREAPGALSSFLSAILGASCDACGARVEGAGLGCFCLACWAAMPWAPWPHAAGRYEGSLRRAIHLWKFERRSSLTRPFAQVLEAQARLKGAQAVVALPPTEVSLKEKGFDHAGELAQALARRLKLPLLKGALKRARQGPPQRELNRQERFKNARGAFEASLGSPFQGAVLLLVDDVTTTGATLAHAAAALRRAGARAVRRLALARTA